MIIEIFSAPVLLVAAATTAAIAVLGTLGNLLAVVALLRSMKLRRPSTYYIVNLAVSNIPVCILAMPLLTTVCVQALTVDKVLVPKPVLHGVAALGFISNQAELHTICVLSFNRVLAMFKPRQYQRLVQIRAYRYVLVLLWLYSVGMWLPLICGWLGELEVSEKDLFVIISKKSKTMRRIFLFFAFTLPLVFSLVCHLLLVCKVVESIQKNICQTTEHLETVNVNSTEAGQCRQDLQKSFLTAGTVTGFLDETLSTSDKIKSAHM
ncbi:G protein-coupled receptor rhodopsin-like [Trinorchestia longiramus]|nr:G protein-coupled receptor rhodopsin-like [Trinorchestia longiramus]